MKAMESDSFSPEYLAETTLDDSVFAAAYSRVTPENRALLKTCIARLYDWYGPSRIAASAIDHSWKQGFASRTLSCPRQRCALFFDASTGPAALLAALVPALAAGVGQVAAIFVGQGDPSDAVLTALELAGQELVLVVVPDQVQELAALNHGPEGCIVTLGGVAALFKDIPGPVWAGPLKRRLGIWLEAEYPVDLSAVAFAHPDAAVTVMGGKTARPEGFLFQDGTFDDFLAVGFHALLVPSAKVHAALERACLVLGPGQEGCWLYPGLSPDHFITRRIAWQSGGQAGGSQNCEGI